MIFYVFKGKKMEKKNLISKFYQKIYKNKLKTDGYDVFSLKEKLILDFFIQNGVVFEKEKMFDGLGKLRFDFYLPEKNMLLEYQGKQHYKSVKKFGGKDALDKQKKNDDLKKSFCEKNGYVLKEITYELTDKEIIEVLKKLI